MTHTRFRLNLFKGNSPSPSQNSSSLSGQFQWCSQPWPSLTRSLLTSFLVPLLLSSRLPSIFLGHIFGTSTQSSTDVDSELLPSIPRWSEDQALSPLSLPSTAQHLSTMATCSRALWEVMRDAAVTPIKCLGRELNYSEAFMSACKNHQIWGQTL